MKKIYPIIFSILSFITIILLWDLIKIPYDHSNEIIAYYSDKKLNPLNNVIRFLLIFIIPAFIYLISYLKFNNNVYGFKKENYFLNLEKKKNLKNLNKIIYLFIFIIIFEFINIDFKKQILSIDLLHDAVHLVPTMNYLLTKKLFTTSMLDYGFIANHLNTIFNSINGFFSIGSIYFIKFFFFF